MRLPKSIYVIDTGGFLFGLDHVTPVSWDIRKGKNKVYTSFALNKDQATKLSNMFFPLVCSYNELKAQLKA